MIFHNFMISNVFVNFGAYSAHLTKSGAGQRDFKVNFMDSNMIPWFLNLHNFMISNVFMKFSEYSSSKPAKKHGKEL